MRGRGRPRPSRVIVTIGLASAMGVLALAYAAGPPVDLGSAETIQRGHTLFSQACTNCHGDDGNGGPVPLRGRSDLTPEEIFDTISNGRTRGSNLMPAWKESLSEAERWELTAFIVSMAHLPPSH
jgi:mono/diheme cytochrome c family protein